MRQLRINSPFEMNGISFWLKHNCASYRNNPYPSCTVLPTYLPPYTHARAAVPKWFCYGWRTQKQRLRRQQTTTKQQRDTLA